MIDAHYWKMTNLPMKIQKATSLKTFYDTARKHLQGLQSPMEDDNQMQELLMLKSKLS